MSQILRYSAEKSAAKEYKVIKSLNNGKKLVPTIISEKLHSHVLRGLTRQGYLKTKTQPYKY